MSNYDALSGKIKSVLLGVLDSGSNATFYDVREYPTTSFTGYPAAVVLPSNSQQSKFETVKQNVRFYAFDIIIYYQAETGQDTDWRNMRQLMDYTMDALDKTIDLGGLCDFLLPTVGGWGVDASASGPTLVGTITVTAQATVQLV